MKTNKNLIDPDLMYVRVSVAKSIRKLEKLQARYEQMKARQVPVLPAEHYPHHRLAPIDRLNPPEHLTTYILSTKESKYSWSKRHKVYGYNDIPKAIYKDHLDLIVSETEIKLRDKQPQNSFGWRFHTNSINEKLTQAYARIYPASEELAETVHLYDCTRSEENDLIMTPKENLKDAELEGWFYNNRDFFAPDYQMTRRYIKRANEAGYKFSELTPQTKPEGSQFLDVAHALEQLYRVHPQVEACYQRAVEKLKAPARTPSRERE